jgi:Histidine kinase
MDVAALLLIAMLGSVQYPNIEWVQVREGDEAAWAQPVLDESGWKTVRWRQVNPQKRLLWLRAHIDLPDSFDTTAEPFGVRIGAPVAYEAWWNGTRVGGNGVPGPNAEAESPGRIDTTLFIPPHLLAKENVLALRMSSFHLSRELAVPMQIFALRRHGSPDSEVVRAVWLPLMSGGALILGTAYFAVMFFSNRRDVSSLVLATLSLVVLIQLAAESARLFVSYPYPLHILRVEAILTCAAIAAVMLVGYIAHRYARVWRTHLIVAGIALSLAPIAFVPGYDTKTGLVMLSAIVLSTIAALIGVRRRLPGAVTTALAMGGVLACFLIYPAVFLDRTYYLVATVLLLILFGQQVSALRDAQRARMRLELELLKQQIQPHFLMNSLTALTEWIESDPATGVKMIEALADEFRAIATMSSATTVSLRDEIELCRHHLKVMSLRKNQPFALRAPNVRLDAKVPPAIFHTLIENALTHNDYKDGAVFLLEESHAGHGRRTYQLRTPLTREPGTPGPPGKGHSYVQARLREVFGENWRFSSRQVATREWLDAIEVPVS